MKKFLQKFVIVLLILGIIQAILLVWFPKIDKIFGQIFMTQFIIGLGILVYLFIDWLTNKK
nr:hypothetical protein [Candidatus Gracilibacteria bacterium]